MKLKRRYTWILLSQNGQVVAVDDKTMTVALVNAGARNSFTSGGSEEILRQAAIDVIGHDWRIEAIVDPSAQPGAEPPLTVTRPAVAEQPAQPERAAARDRRRRPPVVRSTRSRSPPRGARSRTPGRPATPVRDRRTTPTSTPTATIPTPTTTPSAVRELLERELGASIIEEIKHD